MRQSRKQLIEQTRTIINKADAEKRELNSEEQAEYDRIDADIEALDTKIEEIESEEKKAARREKLEAREKSLGEYVGEKRTQVATAQTPGNLDAEMREFKLKAFAKYFVEGRGALSEKEFRALSVGTGSKGGYITAPHEFVAELLKNVDNRVHIRQRARKFTCQRGATLGFPALDARAAVFTRGSEISEPTENDSIAFGQRELKPIELKSLFKISEKLLSAAVLNVDGIIRDEIGYALGITEEQEFMTGTGAGQALGLFTASDYGISTGRDVSTDNTTTAVTFDNLIEVQESVKEQYQGACEWLGSRTLAKKCRKLKGTDGQYIWEESGKAGSPSLLLGKPFIRSEYVPATFTAGLYVGLYGDLSNYWIADSLDLQILELNELYAVTFQKGYRVQTEMDAMPVREEAFARIKLAAS